MVNKEAEMFHKQAMAYLGQGETKKAIEFFDKALKHDDQYFPAWNNKGVALLELEDYSEAEKCFGMVIRLNPADKLALYNRSYALIKLGDNQQAVELLDFFMRNISKKNDFFKFGLYLQAEGFYNLKEYDKAASLLRDTLRLDKNFKDGKELLDKVYKEMKDYGE
ncbi:MAG TPA: tetratricopeptide repeat protein [Methanobacterium sp.]|nr:tetratricopeptide repeat protein [Methanobacterium sp.]